jgi:hypothetical protein
MRWPVRADTFTLAGLPPLLVPGQRNVYWARSKRPRENVDQRVTVFDPRFRQGWSHGTPYLFFCPRIVGALVLEFVHFITNLYFLTKK